MNNARALRIFVASCRTERIRASIPQPAAAAPRAQTAAAPVPDDSERWHELQDVVSKLRKREITMDEFNALPYPLRAGLRSIGGWQAVNEAKAGSLPFLRRDFLQAYRAAIGLSGPTAGAAA